MHRWGFALIAMDVAYDADMNAFILDVNSGTQALVDERGHVLSQVGMMLVTLKEARRPRRRRWHACSIACHACAMSREASSADASRTQRRLTHVRALKDDSD
jgi:hypothetical protein